MRRVWVVVFLFTLGVINYMDRVALSVAAQPIAREFNLTPVDLGFLFSSFLWTYLLCLLPVGALVDRFGPRKVNAGGIALWSLATIATGLAWSYASLVGTRLAMGMGEATTFPAAARMIRQWIPARERGVVNAVFNNGAFAGPAFGAIFVGWLVSEWGWRTSFLIVGSIGFIWLAAWLIAYDLPERVGWITPEERDLILAERDGGAAAPPTVPFTGAPAGFLDLLGCRSQWGVALTQGCIVYTQYLFLTWLPTYLQQTKGITVLKAGLYTAIPYALAVLLSSLLGYFSDRMLAGQTLRQGGRRTMIVAALLVSAVILLAPVVSNVWVILGLITITLTGLSTAGAMNFALLSDLLAEPAHVGKSMSIVVVGGNTFGISAPIVTGFVLSATGNFDWAFGIAGLLMVAGATIAMTMTRAPIVPSARRAPAAYPAL